MRLVPLLLMLSTACGASEAPRPPTAPTSTTTAPAAEPELASTLDPDGTRTWELAGAWPAPPTVAAHERAAPDLDDALSMRTANAANGLPDPHGATLHDVVLPRYALGVDGHDTPISTRALVVPGATRGVRFAIFGGILWPVSSLGPELDLIEECTAAVALAEGGDAEAAEARCPLADAWPALLDARQTELATRWWATEGALVAEALATEDRLLSLEVRGVAAFGAAEDGQARRDLEAATAILEHGVEVPVVGSVFRARPPAPRIDDALVAAVLAELDRRAADPAPEAGSDEALLHALGDLHAESVADAPEVSAIVERGEAMVPALLDALDDDARLTRRVEIGSRHRVQILPRYDAVWAALASVVDHAVRVEGAFSDWLFMNPTAVRARAREAMRAYWTAHGHQTPVERRWAVLSDTSASLADRLVAAHWITDDRPRRRYFSPFTFSSLERAHDPDDGAPLLGEPLRARESPSVADLLAGLLHETLATDDAIGACDVAAAGETWDAARFGAAALADLRALAVRPGCTCAPHLAAAFDEADPTLPTAVLQAESGSLLVSTDAETIDHMARWAAEPGFARAMRAAYRTPEPIVGMRLSSAALLALRGVAPSRDYVVSRLRDRHPAGTLEPRGNDGWLEADRGGMLITLPAPITAPIAMRRCDVTAIQLAATLEIEFPSWGSSAERDAAIAAFVERLASPE